MTSQATTVSGYLRLLPSIFSEEPTQFLGRFLLAFEQVLTGLDGGEPVPAEGLEETIARIATLFDARETREEFLPWLAGWVALGLRADWSVAQKRDFVARVVPLYRGRGTAANLAELLKIYTGLTPQITGGQDPELQVGVHSTIGKDMWIDGGPPHRFHVSVTMPNPDQKTLQRQFQIASALIDLQKPAHTTYELQIVFTTLQIGVRSTIGRDTLLGSAVVAP
jgi:phage tail-like protein